MDSSELTLPSPAKLNLFLHITGRRPDGYHELQTLFQLLDYGDTLTFQALDTSRLELQCNQTSLLGDNNLVLQAARLLQQQGYHRRGARISLQKRIPAGAGLGGGSSNAATTLLALNRLWGLNLELDTLAAIGLTLGADVPVFVRGQSAWGSGIGELLEPVNLPSCWYLVVSPDCHVSTADIFSHRELTRDGSAIKMADFLAGRSRNDCEALVRRLHPEVDRAIKTLSHYGTARMTGTGASAFARFDSEAEARDAHRRILADSQAPQGMESFVARGSNLSLARKALDDQNI